MIHSHVVVSLVVLIVHVRPLFGDYFFIQPLQCIRCGREGITIIYALMHKPCSNRIYSSLVPSTNISCSCNHAYCCINRVNTSIKIQNTDGLVSRGLLSMHRVNNGLPCGSPRRMRAVDEKLIITK